MIKKMKDQRERARERERDANLPSVAAFVFFPFKHTRTHTHAHTQKRTHALSLPHHACLDVSTEVRAFHFSLVWTATATHDVGLGVSLPVYMNGCKYV